MKRLTIEINGTGTHNRGAELMAIAIGERMRTTFPDVRIVVQPSFGDFEARARHGFLTTTDFPGQIRSRIVGAVIRHAAPSVRSTFGIIPPGEINVVLDASGFAFSDQWGPGAAHALIRKMNKVERKHQLLILLPQAFGPFVNAEVVKSVRALFERADWVCARDRKSHADALPLLESEKLQLHPDFTLGVKPILPADFALPARFCALVPNYRMLDKTGTAEEYIAFLEASIDHLQLAELNPVFVLHDASQDQLVIQRIRESRKIPVFQDPDPRILKGILGRAELVIGSRFHALVSALSQGVPCIGAGWSHKYPELFHDFDAYDLLVPDLSDTSRISKLLTQMESVEERDRYRNKISNAALRVKERTTSMWQGVEARIRNRMSNSNR